MVRRNPQIAVGHILIQRPRLDADRQDVAATGKSSRITAPTNPSNWPRDPVSGHDFVADGKRFDRHLTLIGEDISVPPQ